ncbi:type VI secretion system ATPase TssH [Xenorhabdus nematophila]|uniref:ClpA/B-type chaperone (Putative ATPase with chaperone activity probable component of SST VI cluster) n=1 Tax=Xenorhabdus nematophila (strain ATCC 19061 / DSM 3370 / CCUG 14189 / LMG 1036 / NCIMB 9965 / AN6) TaxID=406817 RepID=D3VFA9_XENNA|nr:type VI secretion system ATPase TssH [Xenorhabdus nematophila]CBJ92566.1 putative ClpA/B-type chaperone (Putative ATPase with chaperone activity; probable component of SST VI cluster) [Xenorhabdus nematophila ATCC 19061]CEE91012.1 putative ClpA/B-type chaperone (Putative ATPase with chaperone activity; probable component of SST VI cluster) [Xenorhabdus nematophila str. Anatoliense]CEE93076.1 putative ClpA/B-type chaperone (Putative ATPase with chaperone activity; probable component of SST VI 
MIQIDLPTLVNRLNPMTRHALEAAAASCVSQQQPEITVAQLLFQMIDTPLSDVRLILNKVDIDKDLLKEQLNQVMHHHQSIVQTYPNFSPMLVEWLQDSWLLASTEMQHSELRSGVMLIALLFSPMRYLAPQTARLLAGINRELLRQNFVEWTHGSAEQPFTAGDEKDGQGVHPANSDSLLARFTQNMTEQARKGKLDPVLCRDNEIDLMIDILCRRRKNNPIVVGEAGVGKSALIEGLALRIINDRVPDKLRNSELMTLDLGALQAGAAVKGEFEKRFKGIMTEISQSAKPIILFIDEAHTLIGAGNQAGGLDISNLLKPALARGELKTIAATTWSEYKKYFEKDAALSRRFQLVKVSEPTADEATVIMRGLRAIYEQAHGVLIDDEALKASAVLSDRYLSGRQLPDKAIDVLDTACARVAINLTSPPRQVSSLTTELHQMQMEIDVLGREQRMGLNTHAERLEELQNQQAEIQAQLAELEASWKQQQELVTQIIALRSQLLSDDDSAEAKTADAIPAETAELVAENTEENETVEPAETVVETTAEISVDDEKSAIEKLAELNIQLAELQQKQTLVSPHVDKTQIAAVIAEWTGVPLNRLSQSELSIVTELPVHLGYNIKGQETAIQCLHKHLLTARADLRRPGRPLGAFLLVGPSGVGKTETVLQIAELMFGGRQYLTTINMSEFQEKHTVSRLIGSPPGYVGYGEGGVLTEAIRQKPYSVVLLDEVEKAHPDVLNLFYQAFDKGELADGEGRTIDCKNVVFFLTSNLGYQTIVDNAEQPDQLNDLLYPELAAFFKPALLARMEVIPYLPLGHETLKTIIQGKLARLDTLLTQRFNAEVTISDDVSEEILQRATRAENGARMLESIIDGALLPPVSLLLLQKMAAGTPIKAIRLTVAEHEFRAEVEEAE